MLEIAEVDAKLVGVEMTVRGYALTDDPKFLRYQHYERSHTMTAMDKLAQLVADQPAQMRRLELLRGLVAKRLALYSQLSGLGPGHASDVAAAITDPKKRDDMLSARLTLQAMRDDQLKLLASRQATSEHQAAHTFKLAFAFVILAFLLSALGFIFTLYGRRRNT